MDEKNLFRMFRDLLKEELRVVKEEISEDLKAFATKEDLKAFATKEDLKAFATKEDFMQFEARLSSALDKVREGVRLSLLEVEREITYIKSKLRFYDFDYITRQNDAIFKTLKDLYEEKTILSTKVREHEAAIRILTSQK